ncbi:MAG: hypothetical protein WCJ74_02320 [bacterium]
MIKKFLIWLGFIPNPDLRKVTVAGTNVGDILFDDISEEEMVPPNVDDLWHKANVHGFKGAPHYDSIISFLKSQSLYILYDGSKWVILEAKTTP